MSQEIYDGLGFLLLRIGKLHRNLMRHRSEELGLHRGQPPVMFALQERDGISNSDLAEFLEITPATLTNKVKRMEKTGLVIRRRDPEDERVSRIYMTDKGRGIMDELHKSVVGMEDVLLSGFTEAETRELKSQLLRVVKNIEVGDSHCGK
jgi:DNA-binding MarR family transcriptional regulator